MKKICLCLIPALLITMVLVVTASRAAKNPHGAGAPQPSVQADSDAQNKILASVPINSTTELIRLHNEWGPVRFAELSQKVKERWIQAMFKGKIPAERALSRSLEIENLALREKAANLEHEKNILYQHATQLAQRVNIAESDYENLKTKSASYLKLKEEYLSVKSALASALENTRSLAQENENLKMSHQVKWTIILIVVLFLGWLAGMLMGRRRKKRRPSYHVQ